ncbi:matrix extracellular phosphoglycoprotein [Struthio camelus]|uniref:matrix extracellular phosphoglycoprotein n=1 Tax=Struthio camelus TaxID=8801 RepID=UPI003603FAF3
MLVALLSVCLASAAFSTPVPPPPPPPSGKAGENCVGQHRILLKGCNVKHGFYIFKYVYSFSTQRNQTQVKENAQSAPDSPSRRCARRKEEAEAPSSTSRPPLRQEDALRKLTEADGSSLPERPGAVPQPRNGSAAEGGWLPGAAGNAGSREARLPGPGAGGDGDAASPAPGAEGSGDANILDGVESGVLVPPHLGSTVTGRWEPVGVGEGADGSKVEADNLGEPGAAGEKNGSSAGKAAGGDREVEPTRQAVTGYWVAEDAATAVDLEAEGSGEAGGPGTARGSVGGAAFTSVTERAEDVEVDGPSVDEYVYIPDTGAATVTRGATQAGRTGLTWLPTAADDEVNIFIRKANIHLGEGGPAPVRPGGDDDGHDNDTAVAVTAGAGDHLPTPVATRAQDDGGLGAPASGRDAAWAAPGTAGRADSRGDAAAGRGGPAAGAARRRGDDDGGSTPAARRGEADCATAGGQAGGRAGLGGSRRAGPPAAGAGGQREEGAELPDAAGGKDEGGDGGETPAAGPARLREAGAEPSRPAVLGGGAAGRRGGQRRLVAGAGLAQAYKAYGRSRWADKVRLQERSLYAFGQAGPAAYRRRHRPQGPRGPWGGWSWGAGGSLDDSSQSSEVAWGSRSDSRQEGDGP